MEIFVRSGSQISMQEPLSESWFEQPICPKSVFNESMEPDYKRFVSPMESRRMGRLLKRAVATSLDALHKGGCELPDAIISGTGLGCVENTEKFLNAVIDNDEECLPPTPFMQSTHNTISSQVALKLQCHGYNSTYSHRGTSFDSALLDACMQLELKQIQTVLVGSHDEMTPAYFKMLGKIGYWRDGAPENLRVPGKGAISGSISCSLLLSNQGGSENWGVIRGVEQLYRPTHQQVADAMFKILSDNHLEINDIDAVMTGLSGDSANDAVYLNLQKKLQIPAPILWYKHLFGESFSSSAIGLYVAAACLQKKSIPSHLLYDDKRVSTSKEIHNILIYNHFQNIDHSLILLTI